MTLARAAARCLERGDLDGRTARALARLYGAISARAYRRRLVAPPGVRIVGVGGSTLGGSWKTPCAIAIARGLRTREIPVVFVGHGHGARASDPRVVRVGDGRTDVGDEALVAASELSAAGIDVVVGGDLTSRLRFAARSASTLVVDGLTRGADVGAQHHVLSLDADEPWGHGACPPAGDLRAPLPAILSASSSIVLFHDILAGHGSDVLRGAVRASYDLTLPSLPAGARVALVTAIARPDRLLRSLGRRGLVPDLVFESPDHGGARSTRDAERALGTRRDIDVVLATSKCARHLGVTVAGLPVTTVGLAVELPDALLDAVARVLLRDVPVSYVGAP